MADYSLTFTRSARKEFEKLPLSIATRIFDKIELLAENPHIPGTIKLQGLKGCWRMRVGDYRVIYSIDETMKVIDITHIRHRRDIYRDL